MDKERHELSNVRFHGLLSLLLIPNLNYLEIVNKDA